MKKKTTKILNLASKSKTEYRKLKRLYNLASRQDKEKINKNIGYLK